MSDGGDSIRSRILGLLGAVAIGSAALMLIGFLVEKWYSGSAEGAPAARRVKVIYSN